MFALFHGGCQVIWPTRSYLYDKYLACGVGRFFGSVKGLKQVGNHLTSADHLGSAHKKVRFDSDSVLRPLTTLSTCSKNQPWK